MAGVTVVYGLFLMGSDHPEHTHEDPEEIQAAALGYLRAGKIVTIKIKTVVESGWEEIA